MYLLGIDLGTSSVKASIVSMETSKAIASAQYPETEASIISLQKGWAEQSPDTWWEYVQAAIKKVLSQNAIDKNAIQSIGIAYQMHGLVVIDTNQNVLRNSIIWCDSRAVSYGEKALQKLGNDFCLAHMLNAPGNFTASKLAWVKENEPAVYAKIDKVMLPGDFIAMKLSGTITTTPAALSEGVFWDFKNETIATSLLDTFGFDKNLIPSIQPVFSNHGEVKGDIAISLGLPSGIPIAYKAGDQPNNALSLNVLEPGEVAANAGTSGVIYGVGDQLKADQQSRVNQFAHVNHTKEQKRLGMLLCINGTGIMNSWTKKHFGDASYPKMNELAQEVEAGADGLQVIPFGNGAERIFNNREIGAHFIGLDLNRHSNAHIYRAVQEGIAFSLRYGLDILRENDITPGVIRAGKANMFLSNVFSQIMADLSNTPIELYDADGSVGAAIGAGIGAGLYKHPKEAFSQFKPIETIEPKSFEKYNGLYAQWKETLRKFITS